MRATGSLKKHLIKFKKLPNVEKQRFIKNHAEAYETADEDLLEPLIKRLEKILTEKKNHD